MKKLGQFGDIMEIRQIEIIPEQYEHAGPADYVDAESVSVREVDIPAAELCRSCREPLPHEVRPGLHMSGRDDVGVSVAHVVTIVERSAVHRVICCRHCAAEFVFALGEDIRGRANAMALSECVAILGRMVEIAGGAA